MAEVKIKLSVFTTATFYFDNGGADQIMVSPPTYNKKRIAEGYDKLITGKLELDDQDLIFYQDFLDSPIILRELTVFVKDFKLSFKDLRFKSHTDKRMYTGLVKALAHKLGT
jgi:hypothetical protein